MKKISVIIPIYNEKENIRDLYNEIIFNLKGNFDYEIIIVNDGSIDKTNDILNEMKTDPEINIITHKQNLGQSHSILSGVKFARNDTIVTLDGDGQNDPSDINKLLDLYDTDDLVKLVGGIRKKRKDSSIKIITSIMANSIRSYLLNDSCIDTGCGLKVFSKKVFLEFPFFNSIHRFLPALFVGFGYKTIYIDVNHRLRLRGESKYGTFNRLFKGIVDIIKVKTIIRDYKRKI